MRGVLNVAKPPGISSYDVIRRLKPLIGRTRIGHAGTLDPLAQGVLLVLLGAATKIADLLQQQEKEYRAEIRLGIRTDTDDVTGRVLEERPIPELNSGVIESLLSEFEGEILQLPPAYSALRVDGRRAYQLARRGEEPELPLRRVMVSRLELLRCALPVIEFRAVVSKGTYIRALARDIGERLGCGAALAALTRLRIGRFRLEDALALDRLAAGQLQAGLQSIEQALDFLPRVVVKPDAVAKLRNGRVLMMSELVNGDEIAGAPSVRVVDGEGKVLVISRLIAGRLEPVRGIYDDTEAG